MSDIHQFSSTFYVDGSATEVDELSVIIRDPLMRTAKTLSLSAEEISYDEETKIYSFSADLAWLGSGPVYVEWYATASGENVDTYPTRELRVRPATHKSNFGVTPQMLLERMRGLDYADFSPVFTGASEGGEEILSKLIALAHAKVCASLPASLFGLLSSRKEVLCSNAPSGLSMLTIRDMGEEIISCSISKDGASESMEPSEYTICDHTIMLATPLGGGEKLVAEITYNDFCPAILTEITSSLALGEALLCLGGAGENEAQVIQSVKAEAFQMLGALTRGNLLPQELRELSLEGVGFNGPGSLQVGRMRNPK